MYYFTRCGSVIQILYFFFDKHIFCSSTLQKKKPKRGRKCRWKYIKATISNGNIRGMICCSVLPTVRRDENKNSSRARLICTCTDRYLLCLQIECFLNRRLLGYNTIFSLEELLNGAPSLCRYYISLYLHMYVSLRRGSVSIQCCLLGKPLQFRFKKTKCDHLLFAIVKSKVVVWYRQIVIISVQKSWMRVHWQKQWAQLPVYHIYHMCVGVHVMQCMFSSPIYAGEVSPLSLLFWLDTVDTRPATFLQWFPH